MFRVEAKQIWQSAWRPGQVSAAEQVKMNVPNNLTTAFITVIDDSKTILRKTPVMCDLAGNLEDMTNQLIVCRSQVQCCANMFTRHDQEMIWSLRVDILEDNDLFVLINKLARNFTGDNFTEDATVRHALLLHQWSC